MLLLDFPPEIFQRITHQLVSELGIVEAWKLRVVCRTFAVEIHHDIFSHQTKETLRSVAKDWRHRKIVQRNVAVYLYNRINAPFDANQRFTHRINNLVDYLAQELSMIGHKERNAIAWQLCKALTRIMKFPVPLILLWETQHEKPYLSSKFNALEDPVCIQDKVIAAVAAGAPQLVRSILPQLSDALISPVFGSALFAAIMTGKKEIMEEILEYFQHNQLGGKNPDELFDSCDTGLSIDYAIKTAILAKKCDVLNFLLLYFKCHIRAPRKLDRDNWILNAILGGDVGILNNVLNIKTKAKPGFTRCQTICACNAASPAIMRVLLGKGLVEPNKKWYDISTLIAAARFGNLGVILAVLDAGADIEGTVQRAGKNCSPLLAAAERKDKRALKLLLDRGANIPDSSAWPKDEQAVSILRETMKRRNKAFIKDRG